MRMNIVDDDDDDDGDGTEKVSRKLYTIAHYYWHKPFVLRQFNENGSCDKLLREKTDEKLKDESKV